MHNWLRRVTQKRVVAMVCMGVILIVYFCCYAYLNRLPNAPVRGEIRGKIVTVEQKRLHLEQVSLAGDLLRGDVQLYVQGYPYPLTKGMWVCANVELKPLASARNPGGYDVRRLAIYDGIVYSGIGEIRAHEGEGLPMRERVRTLYLSGMDRLWKENAPILRALLLGDKTGISDAEYRDFSRSGTAHLLAVSGLHVGFVALFAMLAFCWLRKNSLLFALCVTAFLCIYGWIAADSFSVLRATVMFGLLLLAKSVGRKSDGFTTLAVAVLCGLALEPMYVLQAGFALSVCSVLGILLMADQIGRVMVLLKLQMVGEMLSISIAAILGSALVQITYFGVLPLQGIFANLLAVPLAAGAVLAGLPAMLLEPVCPSLAAVPAWCAQLFVELLYTVTHAFAGLEGWIVRLSPLPLAAQVAYLGLLYGLSVQIRRWGKWGKWVLISLSIVVFCVSLCGYLPSYQVQGMEATFLSVGCADSAILRTQHSTVLVDTGRTGMEAVYALRNMGETLDAVILTHEDADHSGGIQFVLEELPVERVYMPVGMTLEAYPEVERILTQKNIPVKTLTKGEKLDFDGMQMEVLSPGYVRQGKENEDSLVLRVRYADKSMLMLADITKAREMRMGLPRADVIKVAHHGSKTSTTQRLIEQVKPQWAVVSVGANPYGLPSNEVIERLVQKGVSVLRTDELGAVRVIFTEGEVKAQSFVPPGYGLQGVLSEFAGGESSWRTAR